MGNRVTSLLLCAGFAGAVFSQPVADTERGSQAGPDTARSQAAASPAPGKTSLPPPLHALRPPFPGAALLLSAPLVDMPYGRDGGFDSPSMRQSLLWSVAFSQFGDQAIGWAWEGVRDPFLHGLGLWTSLSLFEFASIYLPPGDSWMHEEWHRAVLTNRGVSSYNGIYHWDIGANTIAVDHVADADLAALKAGHPQDFVRLQEAGIEGEIEGLRLARRNDFFLDRDSRYDRLHQFMVTANTAFYLYACGVDDDDDELQKMNRVEIAESARDFTGFDFRGWVYDLRRPDEPYAASPRGRPHYGGSGFDRYLLYGDLTAEDLSYLHAQAWLSLLNFVSPQLWGRDWLPGIDPWKRERFLWNFALVHELTPFGFEIAGDFLVRRGKWSWVYALQAYSNAKTVLPGLSGELFRYPAALARLPVYVSCGASLWLQPEDQRFRDTTPAPGGAVRLGVAVPVYGALEAWVEGDAKTDGWVAGDVSHEAGAQGRAGLQLRL